MPTFALFGDSYITRLQDYCNDHLAVPGHVYFYGKGGLRTDRMVMSLWKRCLRREPDVCFINIGGTDITMTSDPEDIYKLIVKLVDQLYCRRRVQMVYVAETQTRGSFRSGMTKEEFDRQRIIINDLLRERYDRWFVEFKDVILTKDYDDDLVHMDMRERLRRNSGMRKFQNSVAIGIACNTKKQKRPL